MTFSKSCSDKLALRQCTSLLSSPVSLLVSPEDAYIDTLILPYHQYRERAFERAFGLAGRMSPVASATWPGGYGFRPFRVETTGIDFQYSRRAAGTNLDACKGSNISAVWTPRHQETLINGVLQGRKQTDPKGASALSRMQVWTLCLETSNRTRVSVSKNIFDVSSYSEMKSSQDLEHRRCVKVEVKCKALRGWNYGNSVSLIEEGLQPQML